MRFKIVKCSLVYKIDVGFSENIGYLEIDVLRGKL